jgi:hypothetical protein
MGLVVALLAVLIPGGYLLREYVLPFSGPLEVRVNNFSTQANPLIPGHLRMLEGDGEIEIPRMNVSKTVKETTWSSSRPIKFIVDSDFVRESDASFSFDALVEGWTGNSGGRELVIYVEIDDEEITARLYDKLNPSTDLERLSFRRGSLSDARLSCSSVQMNAYSSSLYWAGRAHEEFVAAEKNARLFEVTEGLPYSTWAARSRNLVRAIEDLQIVLESYPVDQPGPIQNAYNDVSVALDELSTSWLNFYNVARMGSDDEWIQAYTRNSDAAAALKEASDAVALVPDQLGDLCMPQLFED